MSSERNPTPPRHVLLVAVDESWDALHILAAAADLAKKTQGAELHIVHAVDPRVTVRQEANGARTYDAIVADHRDFLDARAREMTEKAGVVVIGHLVEEPPSRAILQTAASIDADTIVVGTHGRRGLARWAMGSVAEAVVRSATCPVWVVREKQHEAPREPEIEPPCVDCVEVQKSSLGTVLWCPRHAVRHPRAHLHYASPPGFGAGSSLLR